MFSQVHIKMLINHQRNIMKIPEFLIFIIKRTLLIFQTVRYKLCIASLDLTMCFSKKRKKASQSAYPHCYKKGFWNMMFLYISYIKHNTYIYWLVRYIQAQEIETREGNVYTDIRCLSWALITYFPFNRAGYPTHIYLRRFQIRRSSYSIYYIFLVLPGNISNIFKSTFSKFTLHVIHYLRVKL